MSEKFKKAVSVPHKAFGRARKKIAAMQPQTKKGKFARGAGVGMAGLFQFLLWAVKYAALDNHLMRGMEKKLGKITVGKNKKGQDKKLAAFAKKYPNLSSHILYYMMMAAMVLGGRIGLDSSMNSSDENAEDKTEIVAYNEPIDMGQKINPQAKDFYDKCQQLEDLVAFAVCYYETYRKHPIQQYNEKVYTRGFGMTYSPDSNGKMRVRNYVKTNKKKKEYAHKPVQEQSMELDIAESQRYFWDQSVYRNIKKHLKRPITVNQFIAICMAGYQYPGHVENICKKLNNAKTQQKIADAYMAGMKIKNGVWGGNIKRRWACAMLAIGKINLPDYMDAYVDGFYALGDDESTYVKNAHFIINDDLCRRSLVVCGNNIHKTSEYLIATKTGVRAMQQLGISYTDIMVTEQDVSHDSNSKRISFNSASKKLRNNAHSAEYDVSLRRGGRDLI